MTRRRIASRRCWCSGSGSWVMTAGGSVRRGIRTVFMHHRRNDWDGLRGGQTLGVPGVDVGLLALPDGTFPVGKPCEEGTGLGDFLLGVVGLGASQRCLLCLCPQAPHPVPGGEVPEKLTVFGFLDAGEPFGQPPLAEEELPVDLRQDTAVH
jgi:hypothetical protein